MDELMDAKRATIGAHGLPCIRSYSEKIGIHVVGRPPGQRAFGASVPGTFSPSPPLSLNYGAFTALVRRLSPGLASSKLVYPFPWLLAEPELESSVYANIAHICRRLLAASVSTT